MLKPHAVPSFARTLGPWVLTGVLAGLIAVTSLSFLRGPQSVHPRPSAQHVGADASGSGMVQGIATRDVLLDGPGAP